jgi:hypothetical protein
MGSTHAKKKRWEGGRPEPSKSPVTQQNVFFLKPCRFSFALVDMMNHFMKGTEVTQSKFVQLTNPFAKVRFFS